MWIRISIIFSIIAAGILSRTWRTGFVLVDKYLGDALYAAMIYALARLVWGRGRSAGVAAVAMTAIELFQLTMIPAALAASESMMLRIAGRLLGTHFSAWDLVAYAVGIGVSVGVDYPRSPGLAASRRWTGRETGGKPGSASGTESTK